MEDFENKALDTTPHPPAFWYCYVDDTYTKQKRDYSEQFLEHINSLSPHIKFTTEEEVEGSLDFLDGKTT